MSKHDHPALRIGLLLIFVPVFCAGCHQMANPFADTLPHQGVITTPSAAAVMEAGGQMRAIQRPFAEYQVSVPSGAVVHGPLLFEEPWEETGETEKPFTFTGDDYLNWFAGGGRFLLNTVALPVSAVVTPVWEAVESDGVARPRILKDELHDAAPASG